MYGSSGSATAIKALIASSPEAVSRWHDVHKQEYGEGASQATTNPTPLVPAQWAHLQPFDVAMQVTSQIMLAGVQDRLRSSGFRVVGTSAGTQAAVAAAVAISEMPPTVCGWSFVEAGVTCSVRTNHAA